MMRKKVVMPMVFPGITLEEDIITGIGADFIQEMCYTPESILAIADDADAIFTAVVPFGKDLIGKLTRCRIIACIGTGYDVVDITSATEQGIIVTNVPDYCIDEVSDHAMALLLACVKKLVNVSTAVKAGKWTQFRQPSMPEILEPVYRLRGQVLGIIGLGNIGRALVPKAQAFGLEVVAYDPYIQPGSAKKLGVELVEFNSLLERADFVSLHATLTEQNKYMIGREELKRMKPTAYLLNVARGALIDENALAIAVEEGQIAGAGLDVWEQEPVPPNSPLLKLDNVIATPHSAQYSIEATAELWRKPLEEVARVLQGEWPREIAFVNPHVKEIFTAKWGTT